MTATQTAPVRRWEAAIAAVVMTFSATVAWAGGLSGEDATYPIDPTHPPYANIEIDLRDPQGKLWPTLLTAQAAAGGAVRWQGAATALTISAKVIDWNQLEFDQNRRVAGELITYKPDPRSPQTPMAVQPVGSCTVVSIGPAVGETGRLRLPVRLILEINGRKAEAEGNVVLRKDRAIPRTRLPTEVKAPVKDSLDAFDDVGTAVKPVGVVVMELTVELPATAFGITRVPTLRVEIRTTAWRYDWPVPSSLQAIPKEPGLE